MRVLMACLQFPIEPGRSYLTTELAQAWSPPATTSRFC